MDFTHYLQALASYFPTSNIIQKPNVPLTVMLISPHPDDECITSSLALRLMHENGAHIINVAVTLGSNKKRKKEREKELTAACEDLGLELDILKSEDWKKKARELSILIQKYQPQVIVAPHINDLHPTHIKSAKLLKEALKTWKGTVLVAWSEFWNALNDPNVLIEVPPEVLNLQMKALIRHEGEIKRNPYHLRLPAWMMDNVRRGGEIIDNTGGSVPSFPFGVIYKLEIIKKTKSKSPELPSSFLSTYADLGQIFNDILEAAAGSSTRVK